MFQNPSKDFMKEKAKIRTFKTNIVIMWALALNLLTFNTWYPQKVTNTWTNLQFCVKASLEVTWHHILWDFFSRYYIPLNDWLNHTKIYSVYGWISSFFAWDTFFVKLEEMYIHLSLSLDIASLQHSDWVKLNIALSVLNSSADIFFVQNQQWKNWNLSRVNNKNTYC